jgi:hypothetical protein
MCLHLREIGDPKRLRGHAERRQQHDGVTYYDVRGGATSRSAGRGSRLAASVGDTMPTGSTFANIFTRREGLGLLDAREGDGKEVV